MKRDYCFNLSSCNGTLRGAGADPEQGLGGGPPDSFFRLFHVKSSLIQLFARGNIPVSEGS